MTDADKIERVKEIAGEWALDDKADAVTALCQIMDTLEFNPYPEEKAATA